VAGFTSALSNGVSVISTNPAVPTEICAQTIVLSSTNWNYTARPLGILGYVNLVVSGDNSLVWTATYQKGATGAPAPLAGTVYYTAQNNATAPINGITRQAGGTYDTYSNGDTVIVKYFAYYPGAGGTTPTVVAKPVLLSAVFSALNV
jgi:hypothetical protein